MRILATFPGRAGDILWALPSIRAISEHFSTPVDLMVCGEFESLLPLLRLQPYLGTCTARHDWPLVPPAEWQNPAPEGEYNRVYQLGYRGWPAKPLPFETQDTLATCWCLEDGPFPQIDLDRPWITIEGPGAPCEIAVGFTENWFELKVGLFHLVGGALGSNRLLQLTPGGRWTKETTGCWSVLQCDWLDAARAIRDAQVFFGDCSALHVLAVALGKPCVIMEPMVERHNLIFWPLGTHGRVRLVRGNDGLPTVDARHCAEVLEEVLCGL